jgi:hypothetical protein
MGKKEPRAKSAWKKIKEQCPENSALKATQTIKNTSTTNSTNNPNNPRSMTEYEINNLQNQARTNRIANWGMLVNGALCLLTLLVLFIYYLGLRVSYRNLDLLQQQFEQLNRPFFHIEDTSLKVITPIVPGSRINIELKLTNNGKLPGSISKITDTAWYSFLENDNDVRSLPINMMPGDGADTRILYPEETTSWRLDSTTINSDIPRGSNNGWARIYLYLEVQVYYINEVTKRKYKLDHIVRCVIPHGYFPVTERDVPLIPGQ